MKRQYWILNNKADKIEIIQDYNGYKDVGYIGCGHCFHDNRLDFGDYIIFDETCKNYKNDLLMSLIKREDQIIEIHNREKDKYIKMLYENKQ